MSEARKTLYLFDEATAGAGDAGSSGTGDAGAGGGPASAFDQFLGTLPEGIRGSQVFAKFAKAEDPASEIALAYENASKLIGKDPATLLDRSNLETPEARAEFFQSMGAPKDAAGYEFKAAEGTPEDLQQGPVIDAMKDAAAKVGLLPDQFQAVLEAGVSAISEGAAEDGAGSQQTHEANVAQLKQEHGDMFDNNSRIVHHAVEKLGGEAVAEKLDAAGLGTDPDVFNFMLKIGQSLMEDTAINVDGQATVSSQNAVEKAKSLQRQAMSEKSRSRARQLNEEAARLYALAEGDTL